MMKLRKYQQHDADLIRKAFKQDGWKRVLYTLPTGGGKTVVTADLVRESVEHKLRVLFLAHRRELVYQARDTFVEYGIPRDQTGIIMASADDDDVNDDALVQIGSKDTMIRRRRRDFDFIVVDEAHHAVSDGYIKLLLRHKGSLLGLTATPSRYDGRGLDHTFDHLVVGAKPSKLIKEGFIQEPRVFSVCEGDEPDLSEVKKIAGDFNRKQLDKVMRKSVLIGNIVAHWFKYADGRPTVVYAAGIRHANEIAKAFRKAGVSVEVVTGETDDDVRAGVLGQRGLPGRLARGETQVVVNCMVMTEGWDCPEAKCAILARPTWSLVLYLQMVGRILRPGGVRPLVLDHAGNVRRLNLFPTWDLEWFLTNGALHSIGKLPPVKICPVDGSVQPRMASECSECGYDFSQDRTPEQIAGELAEIDAAKMRAAIQLDAEGFIERARELKLPETLIRDLATRRENSHRV